MKAIRTTLLMLISLLLLAACAPATTPEPEQFETSDPTQQPPTEPTGEPAQPATPSGSEAVLEGSEVPQDLFDAALADLLAVSGGARSDVEVLKSESVVWNDGSLGCPQPDVMYTQALVDGYQIIFRVGDREYDYHLSADGAMLLCESALPNLPGGTPTE